VRGVYGPTFSPAPWFWPLFSAASMNATTSTISAGSSGGYLSANRLTTRFSSSR
jgi:hypothetical protein